MFTATVLDGGRRDGVAGAMIRVLSLVSILFLAGCSTLSGSSLQVAGVGTVSLAILDIADAPAPAEATLSEAFGDSASAHGIDFSEDVGTVGIHGYLSFAPSSVGTLVVYVFDFVDQAGNRLVRASGQANSPLSPSNPWDVIDSALATTIVNDALDTFEAWAADN